MPWTPLCMFTPSMVLGCSRACVYQVLNNMYPDRLTLVLGDSKQTIADFIEDNPDFRCNLLVRDIAPVAAKAALTAATPRDPLAPPLPNGCVCLTCYQIATCPCKQLPAHGHRATNAHSRLPP
jgi:hypothetical protein